jgi:hypothetical protein
MARNVRVLCVPVPYPGLTLESGVATLESGVAELSRSKAQGGGTARRLRRNSRVRADHFPAADQSHLRQGLSEAPPQSRRL